MRKFDEKMLETTREFVVKYQISNGRSPSLREIMREYKNFYKTSTSKVQRYLLELHKRNLIQYDQNEGIVLDPAFARGKTNLVPLVGECPCGEPITAIENIEGSYLLPVEIFGSGELIILRAKGLSMIEEGIRPDDLLVVKVQTYAEHGDIVVARLNNDEVTVKTYIKEDYKEFLRAANKAVTEKGQRVYPDIYPTGEWDIIGVVDAVIQKRK